MVNILENPIDMKKNIIEYKEPCFRDENPKKFKGNAIFIIKGFKKRNKIIKDNKKNEIKYVNKIHNFRERDASKDIHAEMKFGLNKYKLNSVDPSKNTQKNKTYFHGISTYFNKVKEGEKIENKNNFKLNENSEINSNINSINNSLNEDSENKSIIQNTNEFNNKRNNIHDYKDTKEMSKLALIKCNLLPKNQKKILKSGEGVYISDINTNIKGIYKKLLNSPFPNLNKKSRVLM